MLVIYQAITITKLLLYTQRMNTSLNHLNDPLGHRSLTQINIYDQPLGDLTYISDREQDKVYLQIYNRSELSLDVKTRIIIQGTPYITTIATHSTSFMCLDSQKYPYIIPICDLIDNVQFICDIEIFITLKDQHEILISSGKLIVDNSNKVIAVDIYEDAVWLNESPFTNQYVLKGPGYLIGM